MFEYDQQLPFNVIERGSETRDGVEIRDFSFAGLNDTQTNAYLIVPQGKGPLAGVLFLHGGGQDRSAFLDDALLMAGIGVTSLLIDVPTIRQMPHFTEPEADRKTFIQTVVNVRRGVDFLIAKQNVDEERIGYVGLSFGAWMGGILAGVEKRIRAYVLIAGLPSYVDLWRKSEHPIAVQVRDRLSAEQLESYFAAVGPLDAINFVGDATPSTLMFQFARRDEVISEQAALQYYEAASEPKQVKWYNAQHGDVSINKEALEDRVGWLREKIKFGFRRRET